MRIDHKVLEELNKKALNKTWKKNFQSGVTFKKPYMSNGKPTSYQRLFLEFVNIIRQPNVVGVSGKELRRIMGWRQGTHSDYFAMFTDNDILRYNRSARLYEKGDNFYSYY